MKYFTNLMKILTKNSNLNIRQVIEIRRAQMEREGHFTDEKINWEHYAKVIQAKQLALQD